MNPTTGHMRRTMTSTTPEPSDEALGAALNAIRYSAASSYGAPRWRGLTRRRREAHRSFVAREIASRVERTVTPRVREQATREINASWEKALTDQADAEAAEAEPLPAFNSVTRCRKCATELPDPGVRDAKWCHGTLGGLRSGLPEAMSRRCSKCGYWWLEAPADAPQPQNGPQSDETGPGDAVDEEAANEAHSTSKETGTGPSPAERPDDGDPDGPESPQSDAEASGRENTRDDGPQPASVALVPAVRVSGGSGDGDPHAKATEA